MYTIDSVAAELRRTHWRPTLFTPDNDTAVFVTPFKEDCAPIRSINDLDFFFVNCETIAHLDCETPDELVHLLNNIQQIKENDAANRKAVTAYFDHHEQSGWDAESWITYSDLHKEVYGFRPKLHTEILI